MLVKSELVEAQLEQRSAPPSSPKQAQIYWSTLLGGPMYFDGNVHIPIMMGGNTGNLAVEYEPIGGTLNLGASTPNTILSTSRPGVVIIPGTVLDSGPNIFGLNVARNIADDDMANELFGTTVAIAWANSIPFYLYAIDEDGTSANVKIGMSRNPILREVPKAALQARKGTPSTDKTENVLMVWDTVAATAGRPLVRIGAITMTKDSSDEWTPDEVSFKNGTGIRPDPCDGIKFSFPLAQNGADTGTHLVDVDNNTPALIVGDYFYTIDSRTGLCSIDIDQTNGTWADGTGSGDYSLALPIAVSIVASHVTVITGAIMTWESGGGLKTGPLALRVLAAAPRLAQMWDGSVGFGLRFDVANTNTTASGITGIFSYPPVFVDSVA